MNRMLGRVRRMISPSARAIDTIRDQIGALQARSEDSELGVRWAQIAMHERWVQAVQLESSPPISVIMPTRNRASRVAHALASVAAQTYSNWQLVLVDDGSTDDTPEVLREFADTSRERTIVLRTDGLGAAAARNRGLDAATGELVTFLDDDNSMAPGWLRAVAVTMGGNARIDAMYGAQIRSSDAGDRQAVNLLFRTPYDPAALRRQNYIDLGAVAVRRNVRGLSFDESLTSMIDWDMVLRVDELGTPFEPVPVVASLYTTDAPARISDRSDKATTIRNVAARYGIPPD